MSERRPVPAPMIAHRWLIALIVVAVGLRLVAALAYAPHDDANTYWMMATSLMSTGHMTDGMGNVAYYSAGYSLFLVPFFWLFGATPLVAHLVNVALGGTCVWLTYLVGRHVLPNRRWALAAAAIWAVYPVSILYSAYFAKENLMIPLFVLQLLLIFQYPASKRPLLSGFILGVVYGFELITGAAILATGLLIGLAILGYRLWPISHLVGRLRPALIAISGCLIAVGPWLAYTTHELGTPVLTTNGGFNLYLGNNPKATGRQIGIEDTPIGPEWHDLKDRLGEVKAMSHLGDLAKDYIKANPAHAADLSIKKLAYLWWPPVQSGKGAESPLEMAMRLVWLTFYALIIPLALVPLLKPKSLSRETIVSFGTVVLYCAPYMLTYVVYRYRLPAMPIMAVLAVYGARQIYLALSGSRAQRRTESA